MDVAVEPTRLIRRRRSAGGHRKHGAFAFEHSVLVETVAAVGAPHGKDPVHPAFQDRREAEPPEGKLPDHEIAPLGLAQFSLHIRREASDLGRVHLLDLLLEIPRVLHRREIAAVGHRIEFHRVEIRDLDGVPGGAHRLVRRSKHGPVETFRLGVGVDDEDVHAGKIITPPSNENPGRRIPAPHPCTGAPKSPR